MWLSFLTSTYEDAIWWSDLGNIFFIGSLIFGVLAAGVIFVTSSAKEEYLKLEVAKLQADAADSKRRQAEAEVKLEELRKPRTLNTEAFRAGLKDAPRPDIKIWYQPQDDEAQKLAMQIFFGFLDSNWKPISARELFPKAIPPDAVYSGLRALPKDMFDAFTPTMRLNASQAGISIIAKQLSDDPNAPQKVLASAIKSGGFSVLTTTDSERPDNLLIIVVGRKP